MSDAPVAYNASWAHQAPCVSEQTLVFVYGCTQRMHRTKSTAKSHRSVRFASLTFSFATRRPELA